jgi:hypothetical protein
MKRILARLGRGASIHKHHKVWNATFSAAPSYLFGRVSPFPTTFRVYRMTVNCFLKPINIPRLGKVLGLVEAVVGAGDRQETWSVDQRCVWLLPQVHQQQGRYGLRWAPILLASMKEAKIPTLARPCTILVSIPGSNPVAST